MRQYFCIFRNRNVILSLAVVSGLLIGQGAMWTESLVLPALIFVMILSTARVAGSLFRSPRTWIMPLVGGIVMNYGVLGGIILLLSQAWPLDTQLRQGFTILAAVPPAVAVIPFTVFLNGDLTYTLIGALGCYLGAVLVTPAIIWLLIGAGFDVQGLFITLIELIILPLALSRILRYTQLAARIAPIQGTLTNWSFFIIVYTVIGLNRDVFLHQPLSLLPVAVIAFIVTFVLGYAIEHAGHRLQINPQIVTSLVLLGTYKNSGFAAGLALALFSQQTAVPSTIYTIVMLAMIIVLDLKHARSKQRQQRA